MPDQFQINDYVHGIGGDVPLLILGQPGMGKSSIMANAADDTNTEAINKKITGYVNLGYYNSFNIHLFQFCLSLI